MGAIAKQLIRCRHNGVVRAAGAAASGFHFAILLVMLFGGLEAPAAADPRLPSSRGADASGMRLIGYDSLQGRSAYQMVPHFQGGRWLLYVGHMPGEALNPLTGRVEQNGFSVLDVSDPRRPALLHHEPPEDTSWYTGTAKHSGTYHVQICDGSVLPRGEPGHTYMLRTVGDLAHELLDVTDPLAPRSLGDVVRVGDTPNPAQPRYTHKNFWDCASGVAYMVSSVTGWRTSRVLQAFDLGDPRHPRHIRDFGLPGSQPGGAGPSWGGEGIHEASVVGDRLYLAYSPYNFGSVQILDLHKFLEGDPADPHRLEPTDRSLTYPQIGRLDFPSYWGVHTAMPFLGMAIPDYRDDQAGATRDMMMVVSETANVRCNRPRHVIFFVDITEPERPMPVSTFQVPAQPGNYCGRSVYFGPHAPQAVRAPMYDGRLVFLPYFAAGVRVIDMRDPFRPTEVGHYIPAPNANTRYAENKGPNNGLAFESVPMTNSAEVDSRGTIYIADRAGTGLHVLALTGVPARIAGDRSSTR